MKFFSILTAAILLVSCQTSRNIEISNNQPFDRKGEMVEVSFKDLKVCPKKSFVIRDENQKEVAYQILQDKKGLSKSIIFQADVKAGNKSNYLLTKGKPAAVKPLTSGRFVPERKDDFNWENDMAAYRMYGPALAKENPSNGVDIWLKRTTELVADTFYHNEIVLKKSYHTDFGWGLDCYKVGHTLGAGGIAPYVKDSLYVGDYFQTWKIIEKGPLRTTFQLGYNNLKIDGQTYNKTITITTDAGSIMNKAVVQFEGPATQMPLAAGIFLHDGKGVLKVSKNSTAIAETAISEFGAPAGRSYVGIIVPGVNTKSMEKGIHALQIADYKVGDQMTYYFGGGWNKWRHATDEDWFKAVEEYKIGLANPLQIKISK